MAPRAVMVWVPSPRDAELYGLVGEQTCDPDVLADLPASRLEALEKVTMERAGLMLADMWLNDGTDRRVTTTRAFMWLTLQLTGRDVAWDAFDPLVGRTQFMPRVADADEPAAAAVPLDQPDENSSPAEE